MKRYRKKPIVVDAFYYGVDAVPEWFYEALRKGIARTIQGRSFFAEDIIIKTLEGTHTARHGEDYIIRGIKGEIYPCKADIFQMTYEVV